MNTFDHLIFDLDDTLLDTYGQLIPRAAAEACTAMIEKGLNTDLTRCLEARNEFAAAPARADLFSQIAEKFGARDDQTLTEIANAGARAFYDRRVEKNISLFPGVRDVLHDLRSHYGLHLVTAGHPATQNEKIEILNLRDTFDSVTIVNSLAGEKKLQAFQSIAMKTASSPPRHLSIGNRLETDIAPAKTIGWQTCWVKYGEYAFASPTSEIEEPDFTLRTIQDLMATCRL